MEDQREPTIQPLANNAKLQEQYTVSAQKHATLYKKRIPYLIGLVVLILILSYVNTFEAARPITMPILMVLMVILLVLGTIQDGNVVRSYQDENVAMKLRQTGRDKVGVVRSVLWRPFVLLTIVIVVGLVVLFWVSGGEAFTVPSTPR